LNKYVKFQRLEVRGAVRPIYESLGVKRLNRFFLCIYFEQNNFSPYIRTLILVVQLVKYNKLSQLVCSFQVC